MTEPACAAAGAWDPPLRAIIADDEINARIMLRSVLEEYRDTLKTTVVGEAGDGKTLVSMVRDEQPDLVFVDIKMPLCDGLRAIRECAERDHTIQWIIISGFSRFDFAREALHLGVVDYLLKPVEADRLCEVTEKARKRLHEHYLTGNMDFERRCVEVFSRGEGAVFPIGLADVGGRWFFFRVDLDGPLWMPEERVLGIMNDVKERIRESLYRLVHPGLRIACVPMDRKTIIILAAAGAAGKREEQLNRELYRRIEEAVKGAAAQEKIFRTVTANSTDTAETAVFQFDSLHALASLRVIGVKPGSSLLQDTGEKELLDFCLTFHSILLSFQRKDYAGFMRELRVLETRVETADHLRSSGRAQKAWNFLEYTLLPEIHENSRLHTVPRNWEGLLDVLRNVAAPRLKHECGNDSAMAGIMEYIDSHYMENIGVNTIADLLGITPNYLSTLFRRECGKTFMSCITEVRLEKARSLLIEDQSLSIRQISSLVGYQSPRYFSKQFLRYTGVHPSVYRAGGGLPRSPSRAG